MILKFLKFSNSASCFNNMTMTKNWSQQHRMQNNKQKSRRLELMCDIKVNLKKLNKEIDKKINSHLFSPPPTPNFH